jgi:hypothetical protein
MDLHMVPNIRGRSFVYLYFVNFSGCGTDVMRNIRYGGHQANDGKSDTEDF